MMPTLGAAVAMVVNIPEITAALKLDGAVLAKIMNGDITTWNHADIVALQSSTVAAQLPNQQIKPVLRKDKSGTTEIFTGYLTSSASAHWPAGVFQSWPSNITTKSNMLSESGNSGVVARVYVEPYTITYSAFSYVIDWKTTQIVEMKNRDGTYVLPTNDRVSNAMAQATYDTYFNADISDLSGDTWPISGLTYAIVDVEDMSIDCVTRAAAMRSLYWMFTDEFAETNIGALGFVRVPVTVADKAVAILKSVTCNGKPSLEIIDTQEGRSSSAIMNLGIALITMASIGFVVFLVYYRIIAEFGLLKASKQIGVFICSQVIVGVWLPLPTDTVCQLRFLLTGPLFCGAIGYIGTRISKINDLRNRAKKNNLQAADLKKMSLRSAWPIPIVLAQAVLSAVWVAIDNVSMKLELVNPITNTGYSICSSDNSITFMGISLAILGAALVITVIELIIVANFYSSLTGTNKVLAAANMLIIFLGVVLTYLLAVPLVDDDKLVVSVILLMEFGVVPLLTTAVLPAALAAKRKRQGGKYTESSGSGSGSDDKSVSGQSHTATKSNKVGPAAATPLTGPEKV